MHLCKLSASNEQKSNACSVLAGGLATRPSGLRASGVSFVPGNLQRQGAATVVNIGEPNRRPSTPGSGMSKRRRLAARTIGDDSGRQARPEPLYLLRPERVRSDLLRKVGKTADPVAGIFLSNRGAQAPGCWVERVRGLWARALPVATAHREAGAGWGIRPVAQFFAAALNRIQYSHVGVDSQCLRRGTRVATYQYRVGTRHPPPGRPRESQSCGKALWGLGSDSCSRRFAKPHPARAPSIGETT